MKNAYWGYWLVLLGVFVVVVMLLINSVTTANTQTHLSVKELSEAAIIDSVDYGYYRQYGEIKINKEKFMENFIRRMAEIDRGANSYTIEFYDIVEAPPKISLQVSTKSNTFNVAGDLTDFDVVDKIDAVLEGNTK